MAAFFLTSVGGNDANNGSTWALAFATISHAASQMAAGDTLWIGDNHAETTAAAVTATFPGTPTNRNLLYCVDHTKASPGSGDLKTTAVVTTTGASDLHVDGSLYCYGVTLACGTGGSQANMMLPPNTTAQQIYENCHLQLNCTTTAYIYAAYGQQANLELKNTPISFGAAGQFLYVVGFAGGQFTWRDTLSAIQGTAPTTLLYTGGNSPTILMEGVDLSALGSGATIVPVFGGTQQNTTIILKDCKLGASVTVAQNATIPNGGVTSVVRSSASATDYVEQLYKYEGTQKEETTVGRTGGASDGTTTISRNFTTTSGASWLTPFAANPIVIWNANTGKNVSVTLYGIADPRTWSALPNNDDTWFDVEYMGSGSSPQGSFATGTKANNLATGSALTADTSAWDSIAAARQNSHAYSVGNIIKLASNPGRLFLCTASSGNSAGSEPAGYASAVDGGSVTDGSCTFKAMWRFSLTVTLGSSPQPSNLGTSPQPGLAGYLYVYIKVGKASVASPVYWDPLVTLS